MLVLPAPLRLNPGDYKASAFGSRGLRTGLGNARTAPQVITAFTTSNGVGWTSDTIGTATWWDVSYVRKMANLLQAIYGDGGSGFISAAYGPGQHNSLTAGRTVTGTPGAWNDYYQGLGPNGFALASPSAGATLTFPATTPNGTSVVRGTTIQVITQQYSAGGTLSVTVDGIAQAAINTNNATQAMQITTYGPFAAGNHTVVLTSDAAVNRVYGVRAYNSTGLIVDNYCLDGRLANDLIAPGTTYNANITATGGTYTYTVTYPNKAAQTTTALAFNANATAVTAALMALGDNTNWVSVGSPVANYNFSFFGSNLGFNIAVTANTGALTGGTLTLTPVIPGGLSTALRDCLKLSATGATTAAPIAMLMGMSVNDVNGGDTMESILRGLLAPPMYVWTGDPTLTLTYAPATTLSPDCIFLTEADNGIGFNTYGLNMSPYGALRGAVRQAATVIDGMHLDMNLDLPYNGVSGSPGLNLHWPIATHTYLASKLALLIQTA